MARNAVEEFLGMKKTAAGPWSNFGTNLQHAAAGGLATAAVGVGIAGVGAAAGKIFDAATKSHDFKQMLSANPDLQEHHEADPKRFNMMFSTLRTMNPEFSKDPLVAGAFMRQMHESPTGIGGIASEALKHRRDFGPGMMEDISAFAREGAKGGLTHGLGAPDKDRAHAIAQTGLGQKEMHFQQGRLDTHNAQKSQLKQQWEIANQGEETETEEKTYDPKADVWTPSKSVRISKTKY